MGGFDLMIPGRYGQMGQMPPQQQGMPPAPPGMTGGVPTTYGQRLIFGEDQSELLMPSCHNQRLVLLMAERFQRDDAALNVWANGAKTCVDMSEGEQWSAQEIADAAAQDMKLLKFNKMGALIRLVQGYFRQNRVMPKYSPTNDVNSNHSLASLLTKIVQHEDNRNDEAYVDTEVFLDGLLTGRGYFDNRLDFEHNDFGEYNSTARDPFTVRPDCDADQYDPKGWNRVTEARWWSIDEVEFVFGQNAARLVYPLIYSNGYRGGVGSSILEFQEEVAPWRTFGGASSSNLFAGFDNPMNIYLANAIDPYRKCVRVIDMQHHIRVMQQCVVNLETGDREPLPSHFTQEQVMKLLQWCEERYAMKGKACPIRLQWRPQLRVRWTTMVGDLCVYDDWSPYESFTMTPYFAYFRRGKTRGMVDDLVDPQKEINRRRSAEVDIVERSSHSGWMWHEKSMREGEKDKVERFGAAPGINIEWRGDASMKPEKILPSAPPTAMERLEEKATLDLKEIAGINDSALGNLDRVQSGRAIEARQRQSVLGIETYMDNWKRTKKLGGRKKLELIQNHYTEARLYKIMGDDGGEYLSEEINKREAAGTIVNDVTVGKYLTDIDEVPLSSTFLNAQYEELVEMAEKGILPIPMIQDIAVRLSTLPQKELIVQRLNAYLKAQGFLTADELMAAQELAAKGGPPVDPSQVPPAGPLAPAPGAAGQKPNTEGGSAGQKVSAGSPTQSMQGKPPPAGADGKMAASSGMY